MMSLTTIRGPLFLLLLMLWVHVAAAEEIEWKTSSYSHYSSGEDVADVLKDLMSFQSVPVIASKKVKGKVNLTFKELAPQEALDRLARLYQLVWYYDGHALFVYRMEEVKTATLKLLHLPANEFSSSLKRLGILDPRYAWKVSENDGFIYFSGPPRYVRLVMETARAMDVAEHAPATNSVVYRWKDGSGVINFSSSPPDTDRYPSYEMVNLQTGLVLKKGAQ